MNQRRFVSITLGLAIGFALGALIAGNLPGEHVVALLAVAGAALFSGREKA